MREKDKRLTDLQSKLLADERFLSHREMHELCRLQQSEIERLTATLAACRKYADARLTDDPDDGLALVVDEVVKQWDISGVVFDEELEAKIEQLQRKLSDMTADRDSESRWAETYLAKLLQCQKLLREATSNPERVTEGGVRCWEVLVSDEWMDEARKMGGE